MKEKEREKLVNTAIKDVVKALRSPQKVEVSSWGRAIFYLSLETAAVPRLSLDVDESGQVEFDNLLEKLFGKTVEYFEAPYFSGWRWDIPEGVDFILVVDIAQDYNLFHKFVKEEKDED